MLTDSALTELSMVQVPTETHSRTYLTSFSLPHSLVSVALSLQHRWERYGLRVSFSQSRPVFSLSDSLFLVARVLYTLGYATGDPEKVILYNSISTTATHYCLTAHHSWRGHQQHCVLGIVTEYHICRSRVGTWQVVKMERVFVHMCILSGINLAYHHIFQDNC
jgi:hypothetical protein